VTNTDDALRPTILVGSDDVEIMMMVVVVFELVR
jgi:hypothetical protein